VTELGSGRPWRTPTCKTNGSATSCACASGCHASRLLRTGSATAADLAGPGAVTGWRGPARATAGTHPAFPSRQSPTASQNLHPTSILVLKCKYVPNPLRGNVVCQTRPPSNYVVREIRHKLLLVPQLLNQRTRHVCRPACELLRSSCSPPLSSPSSRGGHCSGKHENQDPPSPPKTTRVRALTKTKRPVGCDTELSEIMLLSAPQPSPHERIIPVTNWLSE
jgi:hypothetical protein